MIKASKGDYAFELVEVNAKLDEALNKVTKEMCMGMDYGDMIELNDTYTLSKHSEDDMWSIYLTDEWEEICAVIIGILSKDGNHQHDIISFDLVEYKAKWSDYKESEIDLENLEFVEESIVGEVEIWIDTTTNKHYEIPIEIHRDFNEAKKIN